MGTSAVNAISTAQGSAKIHSGDHEGAARSDDLYVYPHATDTTITLIGRYDSAIGG